MRQPLRRGGADDPLAGVARVPVASRVDLVLLKLYAAGSQDAWDIEQLLAGPERAEVIAQVEATLHELPPEARSIKARIRGGTAP